MGTAVNVWAGYPRGTITNEKGSFVFKGDIAWTDLATKLGELFPPSTTSGIGANPPDPEFGFYRCESCVFYPLGGDEAKITSSSVSAIDGDFTLPDYSRAVMEITYSSNQVKFPNTSSDSPDTPNGLTEVTGLSHQLSSGNEVITLDDSALYWSHGDSITGTNVAASKIYPTIEHAVTWNRVLSPNWDEMRSLIGKVNDDDLGPFQTGTMLEETLLYLGFQATPDINANGTRVWNIAFRFSERRVEELSKNSIGGPVIADGIAGYTSTYGGWNHFYIQEEATDAAGANSRTSGFRRLHSRKPSGAAPWNSYVHDTAIFKKGDLTQLFVQV